jgi:hypothetical protein
MAALLVIKNVRVYQLIIGNSKVLADSSCSAAYEGLYGNLQVYPGRACTGGEVAYLNLSSRIKLQVAIIWLRFHPISLSV